MSNRGGRRSTTWKKGTNPVKPKGMKNKATRLKESLGLKNWEQLASFIKHEGAEKMVKELSKLSGIAYVQAMSQFTEYIKPKLQRVDFRDESPSQVQYDFSQLPLELRKNILDHIRKTNTVASNRRK